MELDWRERRQRLDPVFQEDLSNHHSIDTDQVGTDSAQAIAQNPLRVLHELSKPFNNLVVLRLSIIRKITSKLPRATWAMKGGRSSKICTLD